MKARAALMTKIIDKKLSSQLVNSLVNANKSTDNNNKKTVSFNPLIIFVKKVYLKCLTQFRIRHCVSLKIILY